jgi:hypothetical protein
MSDDWFEGAGRTDAERRFLAVLRERAESWAALDLDPQDTQAWTDREPLYVHVDLTDPSHELILGTLRVEFDGRRVVGGWSDGQLVHDLDPAAPDAFDTPAHESPETAAELAAGWLESQLRRPVERRDWRRGNVVIYREWILADSERALTSQAATPSRSANPRATFFRATSVRPDRRL